MKRMIPLLAGFLLLFALASCDLGLEDGSDLAGTWIDSVLGMTGYTFYADGTGEYWGLTTGTYTWTTAKGALYKTVTIVDDETSTADEFEYYFDPGKETLRMHSTSGFALWLVLNKETEPAQ